MKIRKIKGFELEEVADATQVQIEINGVKFTILDDPLCDGGLTILKSGNNDDGMAILPISGNTVRVL
jgi:hypothetical protein